MNSSEHDKLDRVEDRMWWFAGMHANLLMAARRAALDKLDFPILDAGCGTGGFLSQLARVYWEKPVIGLDLDVRACTRAAIKSAQPVCAGSVNDLPFADAALGAIFSADVLCHEGVDEHRALRHFHRCSLLADLCFRLRHAGVGSAHRRTSRVIVCFCQI